MPSQQGGRKKQKDSRERPGYVVTTALENPDKRGGMNNMVRKREISITPENSGAEGGPVLSLTGRGSTDADGSKKKDESEDSFCKGWAKVKKRVSNWSEENEGS